MEYTLIKFTINRHKKTYKIKYVTIPNNTDSSVKKYFEFSYFVMILEEPLNNHKRSQIHNRNQPSPFRKKRTLNFIRVRT